MNTALTTEEITVYGDADDATMMQMQNCLAAEEGARGVLCADNHLGYSQPIGGAVAYRNHISPSGVGYDIGCGNKAVKTDLLAAHLGDDLPAIMDEIVGRISFGVGLANDEKVDHEVLDAIAHTDFKPQRRLLQLAQNQLGTVGAGNHYVDLFEDEEGWLWVGVHFGSRGFGHKTASGFLALAQGKEFSDKASEGEMMSPPVVFEADSELGLTYIQAMQLAGDYAYAGRDVVVSRVLDILRATEVESVHNHHNYAWWEEHDGEGFWVVRKGCTPAFPGQKGFVGATMGEESVILEGVEGSESALFSTVHGAGRVMSRTAAAGKTRWRWTCLNRECDWFQPPNTHKPEDGNCPECGHPKLKKRPQRVSTGAIDFASVQEELAARGIELRGGDADEAPGAYKRLDEVLDAHGETIRVLHRLRPIGVAMAGADTFDPYKD